MGGFFLMWDYNKLFAEGNIVGIKYINYIGNHIIPQKTRWGIDNEDWKIFWNNELKSGVAEIQYIIRLDEHGNVVEKLFDRNTDMPTMPELETGMFVKLADKTNWRDNTVAYVDYQNNRVIAKEGWYEKLSNRDEWQYLKIVEVFSKSVCCFNQCVDSRVIWRSPDYQTYLDSKN